MQRRIIDVGKSLVLQSELKSRFHFCVGSDPRILREALLVSRDLSLLFAEWPLAEGVAV